MSEPTPETEALRAAYAALNRGDVAGFVAVMDPKIQRIEPSDVPGGGIFHGLAAVTAHVEQGRGGWAEGTCETTRFLVIGDRVIVFCQVHVRLKSETTWRDGRTADVYTFRDGRVVEFRTFFDELKALAFVGVSRP